MGSAGLRGTSAVLFHPVRASVNAEAVA